MTWQVGVSGPFWTPAKLSELERLCILGEPYSSIGRQLGCSRCAAIGKARRMGWSERRTAADPRSHAERSVNKRVRMVKSKPSRILAPMAPNRPPRALPKPIVSDVSFARPWVERRAGQCAFPVGGESADTLSCCYPTGGVMASYCAFHAAAMFAKPLPARSKSAPVMHGRRRQRAA